MEHAEEEGSSERFWCHHCQRETHAEKQDNGELKCRLCGTEGFLEAYEEDAEVEAEPAGESGNEGRDAQGGAAEEPDNSERRERPQMYFCHECEDAVNGVTNGDEVTCEVCHSGFVELMDTLVEQMYFHAGDESDDDDAGERNAEENDEGSEGQDNRQDVRFDVRTMSFVGPDGATINVQNGSGQDVDLGRLVNVVMGMMDGSGGRQQEQGRTFIRPPTGILSLEELFGPIGGLRNFGEMRNYGDYVFGESGLNAVIQHLAQNDPNAYGNPPAASDAVAALPEISVSESLKSEHGECAICKEDFDIGAKVLQMPCKHIFCTECLKMWLQRHNTCPTCRFELRTEDPDYERQRAAYQATVDSRRAQADS